MGTPQAVQEINFDGSVHVVAAKNQGLTEGKTIAGGTDHDRNVFSGACFDGGQEPEVGFKSSRPKRAQYMITKSKSERGLEGPLFAFGLTSNV